MKVLLVHIPIKELILFSGTMVDNTYFIQTRIVEAYAFIETE